MSEVSESVAENLSGRAFAVQESADEYSQLVMDLKQQIRDYVRRRGTELEQNLLEKAFDDIEAYHANQIRRSGQPVIVHPLRVALSICNMGLDAPTVVASLLHDAIEDTSITWDYLSTNYGEWYADIVDGLTKIKYTTDSGKKGADLEATYQKMLAAMVRDVRSLFIKLFDRLDNMKDMDAMPRHKQRSISRETLNVYVPMARRFGLEEISQEHTELCFRYLYPKRYEKTLAHLQQLREQQAPSIQAMHRQIEEVLQRCGLENTRIEEIWTHPASYIHSSEDAETVLEGYRLVVQEPLESYQVLGALHTQRNAVPLKIRDFISNPLWNGHQGLHTQVIFDGEPISFEIVSKQMRQLNEYGIMAHWKGSVSELSNYYRTCLEQLDLFSGNKELRMAEVMGYLQSEQIQVFTPKGDMVTLPSGATVLDFAFQIHTDLGTHCVGAMVNAPRSQSADESSRNWVSRDRKLEHGESVRILARPDQHPDRNWLEQSITARSHLNIRRSLRQQNARKAQEVGRDFLVSELFHFQQNVDQWFQQENVQGALVKERLTKERFLEELGLQRRELKTFLKTYHLLPNQALHGIARLRAWFQTKEAPIFKVENENDSIVHLSACCHPIPGDRALGIPNDQKEMEIHRGNCTKIPARKGLPPVQINWALPESRLKGYKLNLLTIDDRGILFQITKVIKDAGVAILDSRSFQKNEQEAVIELSLEPISWRTFHKIVERLRPMKFVKQVW